MTAAPVWATASSQGDFTTLAKRRAGARPGSPSPYRRLIGLPFLLRNEAASSILNALVAEDLPGPGTVFLEVAWKFVKAVGVDEEITGRVEVKEVRPDKPICKIETSVRNGQGELCLTATATVFTVPLQST